MVKCNCIRVKGADLYRFDCRAGTVFDDVETKFRYVFGGNANYRFEHFCRMHMSRNSLYNMYG